jgi:alkylhydroperoxidase family enzyme
MRVPLVDLSSDQFELHRAEGRVPGHLIRSVAHSSPEVLQAWIALAWALRRNTTLGDRLRELITTRTTQLCACVYEFSHHWDEALTVGISAAQLADLSNWRGSQHFDARDRAVLAYVDELATSSSVSDATFQQLRNEFPDPAQLADITIVVGFYGAVARLLNAFDVPLEADRPLHALG